MVLDSTFHRPSLQATGPSSYPSEAVGCMSLKSNPFLLEVFGSDDTFANQSHIPCTFIASFPFYKAFPLDSLGSFSTELCGW